MVNGLHLYSAFHSPLHTDIHTPTAIGCHARYQPAHQEQLGVRCLAQGHFNTARVGSNRQPSDCQTTDLTSWAISPCHIIIAPTAVTHNCNGFPMPHLKAVHSIQGVFSVYYSEHGSAHFSLNISPASKPISMQFQRSTTMATASPNPDFGIDTLRHFCVMDTRKK